MMPNVATPACGLRRESAGRRPSATPGLALRPALFKRRVIVSVAAHAWAQAVPPLPVFARFALGHRSAARPCVRLRVATARPRPFGLPTRSSRRMREDDLPGGNHAIRPQTSAPTDTATSTSILHSAPATSSASTVATAASTVLSSRTASLRPRTTSSGYTTAIGLLTTTPSAADAPRRARAEPPLRMARPTTPDQSPRAIDAAVPQRYRDRPRVRGAASNVQSRSTAPELRGALSPGLVAADPSRSCSARARNCPHVLGAEPARFVLCWTLKAASTAAVDVSEGPPRQCASPTTTTSPTSTSPGRARRARLTALHLPHALTPPRRRYRESHIHN
jgi:hypothetical protein